MRNGKITYRLIIFALALIFGIIFSAPSFTDKLGGSKISLGLDLQGGLHMLLGVETEEAVHSKIKSIAASVNYFAKKEDVLIDSFKIREDKVDFELLDADEAAKIDGMLKDIKGLNVQKDGLKYSVGLTDAEKAETIEYAINQAVETIRNRLDQFGLAEPTVARQGKDNIDRKSTRLNSSHW